MPPYSGFARDYVRRLDALGLRAAFAPVRSELADPQDFRLELAADRAWNGTPDAALVEVGAFALGELPLEAPADLAGPVHGQVEHLGRAGRDAVVEHGGFEAEATAHDGWLMIGAGETVTGQSEAFAPACNTSGLYKRVAPLLPPSLRAAGGR